MGFFKDFKDDVSEVVDEMIFSDDNIDNDESDMINTLTDNVDVEGELTKLDGLLESASKKVDENTQMTTVGNMSDNYSNPYSEVKLESTTPTPVSKAYSAPMPASDENAIITAGMTITGDIETSGSIDIEGRVNGNIVTAGKLTVTGMIKGNSSASEVFADAARIDGEINSSGTVKVGSGSIVIGNITATSAVIAGAVKGDIDVQGPVVVDTSAVVMGNVKSRSVQINNGAVIEGFCSQAYSETDVSSVFEG